MAGQVLKRPSGKWAIRWHDPTGQRHYETVGKSRRDAETRLAYYLTQYATQPWQTHSHQTLAEFAHDWLTRRDPNRTRQ